MRLDMWLPPEEANKLRKLMAWHDTTAPQGFLELLNNVWETEVEIAAEYYGRADAQFEYACLYAQQCAPGTSTVHERSEADKWFKMSYRNGYRKSATENNLGLLLLLSGDERGAFEWFKSSAESENNKVALYNLGLLGMEKRGKPQKPCDVTKQFLTSADQGFRHAQEMVGVLYAIGKGDTQNYEKTFAWLRRARGEDTAACENFLALVLATYPDDEYGIRNGQLAVTIAERLVQSRESVEYLNTMAAAFAEAKRFDDAIKTQKKVRLKLHRGRPSKKRGAVVKDCENRLASYIAKKPWRDTSLRFEYCWDFGDDGIWPLPNLTHR